MNLSSPFFDRSSTYRIACKLQSLKFILFVTYLVLLLWTDSLTNLTNIYSATAILSDRLPACTSAELLQFVPVLWDSNEPGKIIMSLNYKVYYSDNLLIPINSLIKFYFRVCLFLKWLLKIDNKQATLMLMHFKHKVNASIFT